MTDGARVTVMLDLAGLFAGARSVELRAAGAIWPARVLAAPDPQLGLGVLLWVPDACVLDFQAHE